MAMPVSTSSRRWVSVAAAAGLIIGLVAGQMLHLVPSSGYAVRTGVSMQAIDRQCSGIIAASTTVLPLSDDELWKKSRWPCTCSRVDARCSTG